MQASRTAPLPASMPHVMASPEMADVAETAETEEDDEVAAEEERWDFADCLLAFLRAFLLDVLLNVLLTFLLTFLLTREWMAAGRLLLSCSNGDLKLAIARLMGKPDASF